MAENSTFLVTHDDVDDNNFTTSNFLDTKEFLNKSLYFLVPDPDPTLAPCTGIALKTDLQVS
jgi:hypothetical protein